MEQVSRHLQVLQSVAMKRFKDEELSKHKAFTCFWRCTTSISSCRLLSFWACRPSAKALLLVFSETLKKEETRADSLRFLCLILEAVTFTEVCLDDINVAMVVLDNIVN
ncbi:hypothetical protein EYF80_052613 [Liparis tanakae]|uniref:Uncharacterized protein n=1 Tax=Liparis tanakae TaxID=230148 RepID=A0A4Z2F7K9_9TELE|nr:hypothetical protein EYF80_052613 [Liparis tanakae]